MWTAGKGLFLRSCTTWLVLVLFLLSCTAQPLSLKTTLSDSQGTTTAKSNVSWIPQDVYYQKGTLPTGANFKIQDYPQDCGGSTCSVTALSANMSWPSVGGSTSASISLGNANNYSYGFRVMEWGKNSKGQTFAALVEMGMSAYAGQEATEPPYLRRSIGISYMYFRSTDGVQYVATNPYGGSLYASFSIYEVKDIPSISNTICQFWQVSGTPATIVTPTLSLDPVAQTATVGVGFSNIATVNGQNWLVINPDLDPPLEMCANVGASGSASGSMSMTVHIPFIKEVPDLIDVHATPGSFSPADNETSKVTVTPFNDSRPWTLKVRAKSLNGDCTFTETTLSSGSIGEKDISFGGAVPDGEYELIADYDDANAPKEPGTTTVTANSPFEMKADPTQIGIGGSSTISVTKAPVCPGWTITQMGGKHVKTFPTSPDVSCTDSLFATNIGAQAIPWNGTCSGTDAASGNVVSGPVADGVTFKGQAGDKTASVSVSIQGITPTPCPTGENCPPPGPPCPEGQVCPPGPTNPPGPTEPPPPPPGPTAPPPPPCIIEICKPRPCPPGKVCPKPRRTPRPGRSPKPPTPPTPTPTPGGGSCPADTDAQQVQDSGYNLMSQTPDAFEDTRELNQSLNQWNNLQDRLNEGGFTTAALKPKQEERLQEKLEAANLRFQDLYWNVRDELGYLEPMRRQLAEVLQKQAGSLPSVTLSSNLVAQAESYAQQFKAQKGDLDGLEELKILYSELQTYLWVTQLFIEQDSPNQEVVEALRKLKGQIVNHSEYLAQRPDTIDRGTPELDQLYNAYLNTSIQELTALSAELGGDFQIQAGPSNDDLKQKVDRLKAAFDDANLGKTTAERKAKMANVQKNSLSLWKSFSKVKAFGPAGRGKAILSALRTIGEIALKARDIQLSLEEINEECLGKELEEKLKKIQAKNLEAIHNYKQLLDKTASDPCLENADPEYLEKVVRRVLGAGDAAITQGSLAPIQTKYDRLLEVIQQVKVSASESELRGILAEADGLLALLEHFVGNAQKYLKELDIQCENPCKNDKPILTLATSNALNQNIYNLVSPNEYEIIDYEREIARRNQISDINRLIQFYGDGKNDLRLFFFKMSTGFEIGDTFTLIKNVKAPYGHEGRAVPKLAVFCEGDELEMHWYTYRGGPKTSVVSSGDEFEYKLKCYEGKGEQCEKKKR